MEWISDNTDTDNTDTDNTDKPIIRNKRFVKYGNE